MTQFMMIMDDRRVKLITALVFVLYVVLLMVSVSRHELWGDEIHSWNIAKSSKSLADLITNIRYEGHPPAWYLVLFTISRFSHDTHFVQWVHLLIAATSVGLILFRSPFPSWMRWLIPFGYYFFFEYSVLSRNYALGVLISCTMCMVIQGNHRYREVWFFLLLFVLSITHLLGALLAMSFSVFLAFDTYERRKLFLPAIARTVVGAIIVLPALYFVSPPSDSEMNFAFWMDRWNLGQLQIILQIPLKAFLTIPAWWEHHLWNTNFLIEWQHRLPLLRFVNAFVSLILIAGSFYLLKGSKKSLYFFICNGVLTGGIALVFPLTSTRYVGFVFIAFVMALWLSAGRVSFSRVQKAMLVALLVIQMAGGLFMVRRDWSLPFSNSSQVAHLHEEVADKEIIVTDYWCLNNLSAFVDRPFYCLELKRELSFLLWDQTMAEAMKKKALYTNGLRDFLERKKTNHAYLITVLTLEELQSRDPELPVAFQLVLQNQYENAIEPHSNVYLYLITQR